MLNKKGLPELAVLFLTLVLLFCLYSEVLLHPNNYLYSPGGDGIKNYYTYLFHAKYDTGFWNFSGMNYPYYEHMVYTDGHPLLSYIIGRLGLSAYGIGILNFLMLLSYPISAVFLFKILKHYKVNVWWSILGAVTIAFLSPQVFRLTGHFSLSYAFAIPGMWYLLIKVSNNNRFFWSLACLLYVLAFFFTHPYLGMILVMFALAYWFIYAIVQRKWKRSLINISVMALAPMLIFQLAVYLTDTHTDRTGAPQGFYDYHARWSSILVPHNGPVHYFTDKLHLRIPHWETLAYVGFGTIVIFLILLVHLIRNRSSIPFKQYLKSELGIFILAAWLVLVFSFCFPLRFSFMHWLVDLLAPLKQFRVLGRFAWIFFYVCSTGAIVLFYRYHLTRKNKPAWVVVFICLMAIQLSEGLSAHYQTSHYFSLSKNSFKEKNLDPKLTELIGFINRSDYDALMVLPFQHMSSENIMLLGSEEANFDAFMLSYHCQMPTLNCSSSRMSITEAIKFNNFLSPEYIEKELVYDFPKGDKILIIKRRDYCTDEEMRLYYSSTEVFNNVEYVALEFRPEKWNTDYYFNEVLAKEKLAVHDVGNGFKSASSQVWFYYKSWDEDIGKSLDGPGAWHSTKQKVNVLHEISSDIPEGDYTVSFWYYLGVDAPTMMGIVDQDFSGDRESVWTSTADVKLSTLVVDKWCRVRLHFTWTDDTEKVTIYLQGSGNQTPFYVDELLIYPTNASPLFKRAERKGVEYIIYNNEWIRADSFSEKHL